MEDAVSNVGNLYAKCEEVNMIHFGKKYAAFACKEICYKKISRLANPIRLGYYVVIPTVSQNKTKLRHKRNNIFSETC